jgi:cyclopropane fatty-acyl-phospholipid synthase-like methyltransferase
MMERPFSQACENNKAPILAVLKNCFADVSAVLEVGSGTGQHAAFFAEQLTHLHWQPTDQQQYLGGVNAWVDWAELKNLSSAIELNVNHPWPVTTTPAIFSANTLHIMSWQEVERFFRGVKEVLSADGVLAVYGPFNYQGQFSSDSNARFDQWLKARDSLSGIRDFEAVNALAEEAGLVLMEDHQMPANNRCLVWRKQ